MSRKGNCAVCLAIILRQGLPSVGNRHETRIQCEYCNVYLCVTAESRAVASGPAGPVLAGPLFCN